MFEFIKNTQTSTTGKKPKNKTTTSHQQGLCQTYLLVLETSKLYFLGVS